MSFRRGGVINEPTGSNWTFDIEFQCRPCLLYHNTANPTQVLVAKKQPPIDPTVCKESPNDSSLW